MKLAFRNNKDFWSGVMFIAIGCGSAIGARNYPFGSTLRMGPGYMPTVLGVILTLFGIYIALRGLRKSEMMTGNWSLRALIILPLATVLFGAGMEYVGFIPSMIVLIIVSAAASDEFKWVEVLLTSVTLTAVCSALFVWGLGLPFPLFIGF